MNDRVVKGRRILRERLTRRGATLAALSGVLAKDSMTSASDHLIAETLAKAPLFAAGQSASQLGISRNVVMAANKLSVGFQTAKTVALGSLGVGLILLVSVVALINGRSRPVPVKTLCYFRFEEGRFLESSDGSVVLSNQNIRQLSLLEGGPAGFAQIPNNKFALTAMGPVAALTTRDSIPVDDAFTIELLVRFHDLSVARPPNKSKYPVLAAQATDCEDATQFSWALSVSTSQNGELGLSVSDGKKLWPNRSGILLQEDRDYFVSASFDIRGYVRFYVKDLVTGVVEERTLEHRVPNLRPDPRLMIVSPHDWGFVDGVIDEVRFSRGIVPVDDLLVNAYSSDN